jgi:hypothetical protein
MHEPALGFLIFNVLGFYRNPASALPGFSRKRNKRSEDGRCGALQSYSPR